MILLYATTFFNGELFVLRTDLFVLLDKGIFRTTKVQQVNKEKKYFSYLLQVKFWHTPFHLLGGGPKPSSEKDGESGHMPVSSMPTMISPSNGSSSVGV
jgi:hypothetical protein